MKSGNVAWLAPDFAQGAYTRPAPAGVSPSCRNAGGPFLAQEGKPMHGPRELGRPRPLLPPFLSRPLGPCRRLSFRTLRPGSPHPLFAPLRFVARIRPTTAWRFAHAPVPGTERRFRT